MRAGLAADNRRLKIVLAAVIHRFEVEPVDGATDVSSEPVFGNSAPDPLATASYPVVIGGASYRERLSSHRALLGVKGVIDQPTAT